jgi:hypothetical protein
MSSSATDRASNSSRVETPYKEGLAAPDFMSPPLDRDRCGGRIIRVANAMV